jgi:cytosine/adenosine deaminase-related metal-dependent hydrolase
MPARNVFYDLLADRIGELGGLHNAHLHLDRNSTLDPRYMAGVDLTVLTNSYVSLKKKHSLIHNLHAGPAFETADLETRVNACIDQMVSAGTRRADTMVDVTADRVGLSALDTLGEIRDRRRGEIELRLGAYTPFGFRDTEPARWETYTAGAEKADFLGCLPEADDIEDYPNNIGFEVHCERHLELAARLGKMLHVHTDQRNDPAERGTERLLDVMRVHGGPSSADGAPVVWAVHMVSPAAYDEDRHRRLVDSLLRCNIGVITCPSAALGMRQLRPIYAPTHNSIPRVLEMLRAGVHVRLGSDNVADICSPSTTADLTDELFVLSAAIRFYDIEILARLGAGLPMTETDRERIADHLSRNEAEIEKVLRATGQIAAE